MPRLEISIDDFRFPKTLDPDKANFRFVVEARFFGEKNKPASEAKTLPGVDSYWDCDWRKDDDSRYVGPKVTAGKKPSAYGTIDKNKLNPHMKSFLITTDYLRSLNFTIWDVDRKDFWDTFLDKLSKVVEGLLGKASELLPGSIGLSDDLKSAIAKKLAGPSDKEIGSDGQIFTSKTPSKSQTATIKSNKAGYKGQYKITFTITELT